MLSLQKGCLVMRSTMATSTNALRPPPPPSPRQYRTDCALQTRYTSTSRASFAIQRMPAVFECVYFRIFRSSGEDITRDTFPGVNTEKKLGSQGNRTRAGSTVSGAQACSRQTTQRTVYEIQPPRFKQPSINRMISLFSTWTFPLFFFFFLAPPSL